MGRSDSLEKTQVLGKTEGKKRRGQQVEMVGWHHRRNGHEFEPSPGDGEGQGSLMCCMQSMRLQITGLNLVSEQNHCIP